ncbi:MAG: hypothetical protein NTV22_11525 [bacterium]|nr:hypothetical protein [bacterium]
MLDDFKEKRLAMSLQLKETLAQGKSLRKKDFDTMMKDIMDAHEARESEARMVLKTYLEEQKQAAAAIRDNLAKTQRGAKADADNIQNSRKMLADIQASQQAREEEVRAMLLAFRNEHKLLAESLHGLLEKGAALRIRDVKVMLESMRAQRTQWRAEIKQAAGHWSDLVSSMAAKRAESRNGGRATAAHAPGYCVTNSV